MLRNLLLSALVLLTADAYTQYDRPESVEYDPVGDRYFVSSTLDHTIKLLTTGGTVTDFVTGIPGEPYGLEILDDTLYACVGQGIKGYALSDGALVSDIPLGGGTNGITTDGQFLYTALSSGSDLLKIDPGTGAVTVLNGNTGAQPSGLVYDPIGARIVLVFWGSNAEIKAYDPVTGVETILLANTGLANLDGITIDCLGNFLVSSYAPERITRYEPTFIAAGEDLLISGLDDPSDIDFDALHGLVCVPNNGPTNNVVLAPVQGCGVGIEELDHAIGIAPNPVADRLIVTGHQGGRLRIFDMSGREITLPMTQRDASVEVTTVALRAGAYVLRLDRGGYVFNTVFVK